MATVAEQLPAEGAARPHRHEWRCLLSLSVPASAAAAAVAAFVGLTRWRRWHYRDAEDACKGRCKVVDRREELVRVRGVLPQHIVERRPARAE